MILSSGPAGAGTGAEGFGSALAMAWPGLVAAVLYAVAALRSQRFEPLAAAALLAAWLFHLLALVYDIAGWGDNVPGARLGFAPVLSLTVWIVIGMHAVESRFVPLPSVRGWLAPAGLLVVLLALLFPGGSHSYGSPVASWHFVLGVGAYGLFGAAVLHAALLDAAERRMRTKKGTASAPGRSLPLLQLERLTFRFVEVGFAVLSAALLLGMFSTVQWRWDHKTVLSLLGWAVFAGLLLGRRLRGWRGRRATRWLYAGAFLLLLAYAGSRFVLEVLIGRPPL